MRNRTDRFYSVVRESDMCLKRHTDPEIAIREAKRKERKALSFEEAYEAYWGHKILIIEEIGHTKHTWQINDGEYGESGMEALLAFDLAERRGWSIYKVEEGV